MSDDDKITKFSPRKTKTVFYNKKNKIAEVKEYLGFEYVKLKRDVNGISFNKKSLTEFAHSLKYTVSIMREINNAVFLYEYFISDAKLKDFMQAYLDGKIEGTIIQIEKINQDFPA